MCGFIVMKLVRPHQDFAIASYCHYGITRPAEQVRSVQPWPDQYLEYPRLAEPIKISFRRACVIISVDFSHRAVQNKNHDMI